MSPESHCLWMGALLSDSNDHVLIALGRKRNPMNLNVYDWLIVCIPLIGVGWVAMYCNRYVKSVAVDEMLRSATNV